MNGKECSKCGAFKLVNQFPIDKQKATGFRPDCKDCCNSRNRTKYASNPKKEQERTKLVRLKYPETYKKWYTSNKKRKLSTSIAYEIRKSQAVPKWADLEAIKEFYKNCPIGYEVDHIIPLHGKTISGLHILENLQYLPAIDNRSKGNRISIEVLTEYATCTIRSI